MPRSGCSALHEVNPNFKKEKEKYVRGSKMFQYHCIVYYSGALVQVKPRSILEIIFFGQW